MMTQQIHRPRTEASHTPSILRCICGARLRQENFTRIPERSIWLIKCYCGTEYSHPLDHPFFQPHPNTPPEPDTDIIIFPGFKPATERIPAPPKMYNCKSCGASIEKERALKTFGLFGKALCQVCQGRET